MNTELTLETNCVFSSSLFLTSNRKGKAIEGRHYYSKWSKIRCHLWVTRLLIFYKLFFLCFFSIFSFPLLRKNKARDDLTACCTPLPRRRRHTTSDLFNWASASNTRCKYKYKLPGFWYKQKTFIEERNTFTVWISYQYQPKWNFWWVESFTFIFPGSKFLRMQNVDIKFI